MIAKGWNLLLRIRLREGGTLVSSLEICFVFISQHHIALSFINEFLHGNYLVR